MLNADIIQLVTKYMLPTKIMRNKKQISGTVAKC
jgi:hypothetical protein